MKSCREPCALVAGCVFVLSVYMDEAAARQSSRHYTKTQYPIVLVHGMLGFDKLFGSVDYWHGIPDTLRRGGAEVFLARVSPLHSAEHRGTQLLHQVEEVLAITGAERAHLIGHSFGGLDIRYVAAVRPDLTASATSVGSPHAGADLADFLRDNLREGSFSEHVVATLAEFLGDLIGLFAGSRLPQDAVDALRDVTSQGAAVYAARYPKGMPKTSCGQGDEKVDETRFYSWSGGAALTTALDPTDAMLGASSLLYDDENDGLVGTCSSHFGRVIRDDYFLNHLDLTNQVLGATSWFETDPKSLFRMHANRLKRLGL